MKKMQTEDKRISGFIGLIYEKFKNQTECANALGWKKQKLNRIANGISKPDVDDVNNLAIVFGVPVSTITGFWQKQ